MSILKEAIGQLFKIFEDFFILGRETKGGQLMDYLEMVKKRSLFLPASFIISMKPTRAGSQRC